MKNKNAHEQNRDRFSHATMLMYIVTIHQSGLAQRSLQLIKQELVQPCILSNSAMLSFHTQSRNGVLALGRPRNEIAAKKKGIS